MRKKLKDLKKGDRMWLQGFTGTTPIYVEKKKREGDLCIVTMRWDNEEHVSYGHALGWTCVGYCKKYNAECIFTTDYQTTKSVEEKREAEKKYAQIGRNISGIINILRDLDCGK